MPAIEGVEHSFHDLPTGVRVHLAAAGPADAPPVLALHGFPQHWWSWRHVIAALGGEFRVLCPDMRGFGWSGWPADGDFVKERVADDAIALLDTLGIERVRLVGHDWGAYAAILAALQRAGAVLEPARDVDRAHVGAARRGARATSGGSGTSCRSPRRWRRGGRPRRPLRAQMFEAGRRDGR